MKKTKQPEIWLEHSIAALMAVSADSNMTKNGKSKPKHKVEEDSSKQESHKLSNAQSHSSAYFRKLSDVFKAYEEVIVFGSQAKQELLNSFKDSIKDKKSGQA